MTCDKLKVHMQLFGGYATVKRANTKTATPRDGTPDDPFSPLSSTSHPSSSREPFQLISNSFTSTTCMQEWQKQPHRDRETVTQTRRNNNNHKTKRGRGPTKHERQHSPTDHIASLLLQPAERQGQQAPDLGHRVEQSTDRRHVEDKSHVRLRMQRTEDPQYRNLSGKREDIGFRQRPRTASGWLDAPQHCVL